MHLYNLNSQIVHIQYIFVYFNPILNCIILTRIINSLLMCLVKCCDVTHLHNLNTGMQVNKLCYCRYHAYVCCK